MIHKTFGNVQNYCLEAKESCYGFLCHFFNPLVQGQGQGQGDRNIAQYESKDIRHHLR